MKKKLLAILGVIASLSLMGACNSGGASSESTSNDSSSVSTPDSSTPDSSTAEHTHAWASDWSKDETNHWHACTDASCEEKNDEAAHSGGTATSTDKAVCTVCGQPYGELAMATWTVATYDDEVCINTNIVAPAVTLTYAGAAVAAENIAMTVKFEGETVDITQTPTSPVAGTVEITWSYLDATKSIEIEFVNHVFDNNCESDDKCANCDVTAGTKSHVFDNNCTTDDECQNDGCTVKDSKEDAHVFDNNCTTDDECQNDGCTVKDSKEDAHIFDNNCTTDDECQNDGCTVKDSKEDAHVADDDDGDCTTPIYCMNEGCEQIAKAGNAEHAWDEGQITDTADLAHDGTITYTCEDCEQTKEEFYKSDSIMSLDAEAVSYVGEFAGKSNVYKFTDAAGYVIIDVENVTDKDYVDVKLYVEDTETQKDLFVFSTCIGNTDNHDHDSEDHTGYYVGRSYAVIRAAYVNEYGVELGDGTSASSGIKSGWNTVRIYTIKEQKTVKLYVNNAVTWYAVGDCEFGNTTAESLPAGVTATKTSYAYVGELDGVENVWACSSVTGASTVTVDLDEGGEYDYVEMKLYLPEGHGLSALYYAWVAKDGSLKNGYPMDKEYTDIKGVIVDENGAATTIKDGWNTIRFTKLNVKAVGFHMNVGGKEYCVSTELTYGTLLVAPELKEMSFSGVGSAYIGEFEGEEHVYAMSSGDSTNARINLDLSKVSEYNYVDVKVYVPDTSKLFVNSNHPKGTFFTGNVCTGNTANHNHASEKKEGYFVGVTYDAVKVLYVDESGIPIAIKNGWNTIRIYMVDELESAYIQVNQKNVNYYVSADLTWGNELVEPDLKEMSFSDVTNSYIGEFEGEEHVYAMNSGDSTNARVNLDLSAVTEYDYVDVKIYLPEGHGLSTIYTGNVCIGNTSNHQHASEKHEGYKVGTTYEKVKALYVDANGAETTMKDGWNTIRIYMVDELQSAYIQVNVKNVSYYVSADLAWDGNASVTPPESEAPAVTNLTFEKVTSSENIGAYEGEADVWKLTGKGQVVIDVEDVTDKDWVDIKVYISDTSTVKRIYVYSYCIGNTTNHDHASAFHDDPSFVGDLDELPLLGAEFVDASGNETTIKNGWNVIRCYTVDEQKEIQISVEKDVTWYVSNDVVYGNEA